VDSSVPVVLVKCVRGLMLHGALCAARSLGRLGVHVYALQDAVWAPISLSRYVSRALPVRFWKVGPDRFEDTLLQLAHRIGRKAILLPVDDVATLFVADRQELLSGAFLFPRQPPGLVRTLASKMGLFELCREHGVPAPQTIAPRCRDEVLTFLENATFPVVMKSSDPELLHQRRTARSVKIVHTRGELLEAYDRMENPAIPNILLQEYIPGEADSIWMFNGYFGHNSECLFGVAGQKLRQFPRHTGATSLGVCKANRKVEALATQFLAELGYRGIVDMGYRYDARRRQYKLLDVNPRMGASFRLFGATDGMDVVRVMYLDMTGQPLPASVPAQDTKWLVETDDVLTYLEYYRSDGLTLRDWLESVRDVREGAWFAADDPLPFLAACGGLAVKASFQLARGAR
jgi:D-aspartate ligase